MTAGVDRSLAPYEKKWPGFKKTYSYTPKDIKHIAEKVAKLYSFFLTKAAHDRIYFSQDKIRLREYIPEFASPNKIEKFEEILKERIQTMLSKKEWCNLEPESSYGIIRETMKEAGIEPVCYTWHYPEGMQTCLNMHWSDRIYLHVYLNYERMI